MQRPILGAMALAAIVAPAAANAEGSTPANPYLLTTSTYTQNFDSLATTGTRQALPAGFQIVEGGTGAAADGFYAAGTGSSNAGNAYSFGATGSTERALGSLTSGTVTPISFGAIFTNGLGATITDLAFGYTGEQWRLANATTDGLKFEFSTDATNLTNGNWTAYSSLDFLPLFSNGTSTGTALNGNAAENQREIFGMLSGLSIGAGSSFGFRWVDADVTGADQGLAVDNLSIRATTLAANSAVPEPGTWAMMLLGFGAIGLGLRRRRQPMAAIA